MSSMTIIAIIIMYRRQGAIFKTQDFFFCLNQNSNHKDTETGNPAMW